MQRFSWDTLVAFGTRALAAKGVPEDNARIVAEFAVQTEACGVHTHGLAVIPYLNAVLGGEIDPKAEPEVVNEKGATACIDGHSCIGQLAMKKAIDLATAKARAQGVAAVAVTNVSWIGALGTYLMPLAKEGLLAQLTAQSSACKDSAPIGGVEARFSTNPIALAFPTAGDPVVADFSSSTVSMGKTGTMQRKGEKAPEPIFMDHAGALTDDPNVVKDGGSILFTGGAHYGHKGYALSLWCEAMTALAGGRCNNPDLPQRQSFSLTVFDPAGFAGSEALVTEMRRFVPHVKSSRLRPGCAEIRLPGERGAAALRDAADNGVAVEDGMVQKLNDLAAALGVAGLPA